MSVCATHLPDCTGSIPSDGGRGGNFYLKLGKNIFRNLELSLILDISRLEVDAPVSQGGFLSQSELLLCYSSVHGLILPLFYPPVLGILHPDLINLLHSGGLQV